jgi:hypothetical protein
MNQERFDRLARSLATSRISRGRMLKMGATAALGSVLGRGGLLWPPGPSRGCSLDSRELECDFHIYAPPAQEAKVTKNAGGSGRCADPPGTRIYLDGLLDVIPMPAVGEVQRIDIYLEEDILRLYLRNGAEANPPLGPDETTVALARRQEWDKRITWTAPGRQTVSATRSDDCTDYSAPMRLRDPWYSRQYTLVFEKRKFLGQWTSMYHWYPPQFMSFFGGKIASYCWYNDNWNNPDLPTGRSFRTSFENYYCERMPDWENSLDPDEGKINVGEPLYCRVLTGSKAHVGRAYLRYDGRSMPSTSSTGPYHYCYFRVFDLSHAPPWKIGPETGLSYYIQPRDELGRKVSLDLVCHDNTRLRFTDAVDQNGRRMYRGLSSDTPLKQWSPVRCHKGRWLAGKAIDRILVGFFDVSWENEGRFSGRIDDIKITDPFEG